MAEEAEAAAVGQAPGDLVEPVDDGEEILELAAVGVVAEGVEVGHPVLARPEAGAREVEAHGEEAAGGEELGEVREEPP